MKYPLYRDTLCPKLWNINEDGAKLDNIVRKGLYQIAKDFVNNLKTENNIDIKIHDIVILVMSLKIFRNIIHTLIH